MSWCNAAVFVMLVPGCGPAEEPSDPSDEVVEVEPDEVAAEPEPEGQSGLAGSCASKLEAEAYFLEARKLLQAGRTVEACEKFDASYACEPALGTVLNIGNCYEKLNNKPKACKAYREAARRAAGMPARRQLAEARAKSLGCP